MNSPRASVVAVAGDRATLRVDGAPACARCQAGRGCGAGLLEGRRAPREVTLDVPPGMTLHPGDRVSLTLGPSSLLRASLFAYGLPLLALLGAPLAAVAFNGPLDDAQLALLAAGALAAAVVAGRRLSAGDRCLEELVPAIGRRLPDDA